MPTREDPRQHFEALDVDNVCDEPNGPTQSPGDLSPTGRHLRLAVVSGHDVEGNQCNVLGVCNNMSAMMVPGNTTSNVLSSYTVENDIRVHSNRNFLVT